MERNFISKTWQKTQLIFAGFCAMIFEYV
jgi:hypothetical protein